MTPLSKQAYAGLFKFQVFLALVLFVPAWSVRYWEAWAYWGVFSVATFGITVYFLRHDPRLIERRLQAGPGAEREKSQKFIQALTSVLLCALFIVSGVEHRWRQAAISPAAVLSADAVIALAFWFIFLVFKTNSYTAGVVQVEADQPVVDSGPYRFIRHPMYAAAVVLFVATPPALGSLSALAVSVPMCGMIVVRLLYEERYLAAHLAGYEAYRERVKYRLVPFVW